MAQAPTAFPPVMPHGELEPVFDDVWMVTGSFRMGPGMRIPRNMAVVREGERLVLVNSVRLSADGEAALAKLGKVTDVVRLSAGHGADDPYLQERYGATMWAPRGLTRPGVTYQELREDASPLADGAPIVFTHGNAPDASIVLARDGGVLISCDAYQHWTRFDQGTVLAGWVTRLMGFGPATIGGPWARRMGPGVYADFERLCQRRFVHLIPGHGTVLRDRARDELPGAMRRRFKR